CSTKPPPSSRAGWVSVVRGSWGGACVLPPAWLGDASQWWKTSHSRAGTLRREGWVRYSPGNWVEWPIRTREPSGSDGMALFEPRAGRPPEARLLAIAP